MRTPWLVLLWPLVLWPGSAAAQHSAAASPQPHEHVDVSAPLLTPTRDATGTSWLPAATPMYGVHQPWRGWDVRLAGSAFAQYVYDPNEKHRTGGVDTSQFSGVGWAMGMLRRPAGAGRFGVRAMLSVDPWTTSSCGVLSLLSTGEVCDGDTVHDRQPPHDFVMELSADYERPIRGRWRWQVYGGLAGEPALGPPGYSHRVSALANPAAPISHHLIDPPTTFGVVTGGVHNGRWRIEASAFNGREADESRTDMDFGAFDSASARLSVLPAERWALQVSAGRVHEATTEFYGAETSGTSRLVASATYHRPLQNAGVWATTLAYGISNGREFIAGSPFDIVSDGLLVESSVTRGHTHTIFGRAEIVAMPAHHLHAHEFIDAVFTTSKLQIGYVRHAKAFGGLVPGIGGAASLAIVPDALAPRYEGNRSAGFTVFVNLRPARHSM